MGVSDRKTKTRRSRLSFLLENSSIVFKRT
jgi:hypothetical protein